MRRLAGLMMIALLLPACGPASKEVLVAKAREVKTRAELERAWQARRREQAGAGNGQVVFVLVGDVVTLEAAGPSEKKD